MKGLLSPKNFPNQCLILKGFITNLQMKISCCIGLKEALMYEIDLYTDHH